MIWAMILIQLKKKKTFASLVGNSVQVQSSVQRIIF